MKKRRLALILAVWAVALVVVLFIFTVKQDEPLASYPLAKFKRALDEPILEPRGDGFESLAVYNPAAVVVNDTVYLLYRAQDKARVSYIGLAHSKDGTRFERLSQPVLWPEYDYEKRGIEDPRIIVVNETYYMTYTGYDGGRARLCMATSKNLREWEKLGPVFPEWLWTKSGAILPIKVNGKYVMYFGDSSIWIAYSDDLVHWSADRGDVVLSQRRNNFDGRLVEPGPPPMLTEEGILLIYNGASWEKGYSVGWVVFSKEDPTRVVKRAEEPILEPEKVWEKLGQVPNVVFAEGFVKFGGTWMLYYGGADKVIGVALALGKPFITSPLGIAITLVIVVAVIIGTAVLLKTYRRSGS